MSYEFKSESEVKDYVKNLGIEYRFGCYSEKNPEVCHLLADFLESVKKDYEKAAKVYKNNCDEFKYSKSCLKYGTYSLIGKGVSKPDFVTAYNYFEKGCNLNETESCLNQGLLLVTSNEDKGVPHDVIKGMKILEKACNAKNANACYYLSGMYIAGVRKKTDKMVEKPGPNDYLVAKNMQKAFIFAMDGCNLGNMYSCANLSQMYAKGDETASVNCTQSIYDKLDKDEIVLPKFLTLNLDFLLNKLLKMGIQGNVSNTISSESSGGIPKGVEKSKELAEKYKILAIEMQKELENTKSLTFQEGLSKKSSH